jgi:hypothetical protein
VKRDSLSRAAGSAAALAARQGAGSAPPAPTSTLPAASSPTRIRPCGFRAQRQRDRHAPMPQTLKLQEGGGCCSRETPVNPDAGSKCEGNCRRRRRDCGGEGQREQDVVSVRGSRGQRQRACALARSPSPSAFVPSARRQRPVGSGRGLRRTECAKGKPRSALPRAARAWERASPRGERIPQLRRVRPLAGNRQRGERLGRRARDPRPVTQKTGKRGVALLLCWRWTRTRGS